MQDFPWLTGESGNYGVSEPDDVLQMDVLDLRPPGGRPGAITSSKTQATKGMDQTTKLLVGGVGLAAIWYFFIHNQGGSRG